MTQNVFSSLLTHTKQLLLVTFCNTSAGIEVNFRTHGRTEQTERTDGWTDGRGSRNSYLDLPSSPLFFPFRRMVMLLREFL